MGFVCVLLKRESIGGMRGETVITAVVMCIPRFWRYHVFSVSPSVIMICSHDIPSWESHMCVQGELPVVCLT